MNQKPEFVKCPDCFGDGVQTCHNPDHGFLSLMGCVRENANEGACPCCGHNENHKMKGKCYTCDGTGQVTMDEYNAYVDKFVPVDDKDFVDEHYLINPEWKE